MNLPNPFGRKLLFLLAGLVGLLAISAALAPPAVFAADAALPALQSTEYPYPAPGITFDPSQGYPVETETPQPGAAPAFTATATSAVQQSATPRVSLTVTLTPTVAPDVYRTEDAQMGGSQVTPPAGETFAPFQMPATVTPVVTGTGQPVLMVEQARNEQEGLPMNWGMFAIGFSLPVLAACGYVLYLLDRRPDLFRPKRR